MTPNLIWAAIGLAGSYVLARYECGFSTPQSVFLTVLAALSIATTYLRRSAAKRFQPFQLWIQPDYQAILTAAGLLESDSDWGELLKANDLSGDTVCQGANCWVLSQNADTETYTIAWPDWKHYTARLQTPLLSLTLESLRQAALFPAGCRSGNGKLRATFGITESSAGLQVRMGIDVEWWKARWAGCVEAKPKFIEDVDWQGVVELTVAVIPTAELQYPYNWRSGGHVSPEQRKRALEALGWETDYEPDYPVIRGAGISNRYVTVTHEPIT